MSELLFIAHRIPYPPNKGDKIRSFHILRNLAAKHRVHLAAFVDDPADFAHTDVLRKLCASVFLAPLRPAQAKLRSLLGLLRGEPLGLPYYFDAHMQAHIRSLASQGCIERVFVYSSTMAQYADAFRNVPRVLDMCDLDSDKWLQYARRHRWPMRWVYAREGRLLGVLERRYASEFDATLLASNSEAESLRRIAPESARRIYAVRNGVDVDFFNPEVRSDNPYRPAEEPIVFTGAMDYWANIDAVSWFVTEVLPGVVARRPGARFYIVGSNPVDAVRRLGEHEAVKVTGSVPDVRPFLQHARVVVAPLRIARGIQNKVLEALAMSRFVVMTPAAMEGLDWRPVPSTAVAQDAASFAAAVTDALQAAERPNPRFEAGRKYVCEHYSWLSSFALLESTFGVCKASS